MIVFVGDSYCSEYHVDPRVAPVRMYQNNLGGSDYQRSYRSWIDVVRDMSGTRVDVHGYAGQSWWHSWSNFDRAWSHKLQQVQAVIFCHSNPERLNAVLDEPDTFAFPWDPKNKKLLADDEVKVHSPVQNAINVYYKYLFDPGFHDFAQNYYAEMLKEKLAHVKTIHFCCFPNTKGMDRLPGMVYTTPLLWLAIGGIGGSRQQVDSLFSSRPGPDVVCHMTQPVNQCLAELVICSLNDYTPGQYEIDIGQFDLPNPNYLNWPDGIYWNK